MAKKGKRTNWIEPLVLHSDKINRSTHACSGGSSDPTNQSILHIINFLFIMKYNHNIIFEESGFNGGLQLYKGFNWCYFSCLCTVRTGTAFWSLHHLNQWSGVQFSGVLVPSEHYVHGKLATMQSAANIIIALLQTAKLKEFLSVSNHITNSM